MARSKDKGSQEVNAGSMADIAFLLLIFFLVTTQIATNKGLTLLLPPKQEDDEPIEIKQQQRNIFKIQVNSADKLLVEDEPLDDISQIRDMVYDFVLNFGDPSSNKKGSDKVSDIDVYNSLPASMKSYISRSLSDSESSDGPSSAIVSLKADRGSSYEIFIQILDELNAAYNRIYGERVGLSDEEFRKLNRNDPRQKKLYDDARMGIPKAISIAEPTKSGS
ncbi:ExbD/TolR family protein [Roseivirga pacifica]|uniref:ExbD/TolR family protein n=1 Tax=Roseivirga pacifica TaxID=1267423 RepID=UPI0020944750|nr:biopolymer transporter ExbD [Roseivirga pacifica]MCO6357638.1 biopolymer transporter ExbD [Roseivirga pacifica]MCO6365891.1 biopolymer transporter ExbD [Roseivirga pacifica]MCO6371219.1 biopolymer transporter ExbD [Roseivirga pacifica]MCO6375610.1 biopolymer transporter ExbD [Roseivirga pacifica]MCO6378597.1 biopolymer transporter ExbD [Roseivirga pacifica]